MTVRVYSGAGPAEAYVLNVTPGDTGVDLSTVTAASLSVQLQDGTVATWTATRSNQTATTLKLTHTFAAAETAQIGTYRIVANLTVPAGTVRCLPRRLAVLNPYGD